jgi:hypothetical protein
VDGVDFLVDGMIGKPDPGPDTGGEGGASDVRQVIDQRLAVFRGNAAEYSSHNVTVRRFNRASVFRTDGCRQPPVPVCGE